MIAIAMAIILALGATTNTKPALAAEGDVISCLKVDEDGDGAADDIDGLGIAFDGTSLYFTQFGSPSLFQIAAVDSAVDSPCTSVVTDGQVVALSATIPVDSDGDGAGDVVCDAIAFDTSTGDRIWCAEDGTFGIWTVSLPGGAATFQFTANVTAGCLGDIPDCSSLIDGLTFDPVDGTIWYSPDASHRVFHYAASGGPPISTFDVDTAPNDMLAECGFNYSSGLAATRLNVLYLAADGCDSIFRYDKSGVKQSSFVVGALRHEDMECDDVTFSGLGIDGIWVKDAFDDLIRAFEVPLGTCSFIKPPEVPGRMTGGGSVADTGVRHGFELNCDESDSPNNLEVNWGKGNRFHLDTLTSASCTDDPGIEPNPPAAGFDTYVGTGTGTVNGEPGHTIEFTFTDAGEPGTADFAYIVIDGGATLSASGNLKNGNQQAHAT